MPGLRDGILTVAAVILAFLAFDDITTDAADSFVVERVVLASCAGWCAILSWRLLRQRRLFLGVLSLAIVAMGVWGQHDIGPRTIPGWQPDYVAVLLSLVWFLFVGGILTYQAWRSMQSHPA